jgi:hypothetical protein
MNRTINRTIKKKTAIILWSRGRIFRIQGQLFLKPKCPVSIEATY